MNEKNPKKFIKNYDNIATKFAKSRKNMKWEEIKYFLEKYIGKEKKDIFILDVGCGSGRLLEHFGEMYGTYDFDYLGIDLSPEMIEEARKNFSSDLFEVLDMEELDKLKPKKFDFVFFIASFHHKKFLRERLKTLKSLKNILHKDSLVFMTNWDLQSEENKQKYKNSEVFLEEKDFKNIEDFQEKQKENIFGSKDFSIKFGEFNRYYHSFSLNELKYLFEENDFEILENRLFENKRNIISILRKK